MSVRIIARAALLSVALSAGLSTVSVAPVQAVGLCGTLTVVTLPNGTELCTHGADTQLLELTADAAEATNDATDAVAEVAAPVAHVHAPGAPAHSHESLAVPAAGNLDILGAVALQPQAAQAEGAQSSEHAIPSLAPQCIGNGTEAERVQAIVVDIAGSNIAPAADADVRRWVGQADWTFSASATRDGAERRLRIVTETAGETCRVAVTRVNLTAAEGDGYSNVWKALANRGFDASNRKYAIFANVDQSVCGIGTVRPDDRPGAENAANVVVGYSQVNAPCWTAGDNGHYSVLAHELGHNLGGIQASAPNTTNGYHCTDEWDVMCYDDNGSQTMTLDCEDNNESTKNHADLNNRLFDCGGDDYFNASDDVTGYLASHWNVANSLYLSGRPVQESKASDNNTDSKAEASGSSASKGQSSAFSNPTRTANVLITWVLDLFRTISSLTV